MQKKIDNLRQQLIEQEERHLEQINRLIAIQLAFSEHTFDIIEKSMFSSEYTIKSIKYIGATTAKWSLKKIRSNVISKLRFAQSEATKSKIVFKELTE